MAITVNWTTRIIYVPQGDLTNISPGIYRLNINDFRLALKDLEDGEGMPFLDTHRHNTTVTVGSLTLARVVEIINGYTVTFEDGQYAVELVGANSNIEVVTNVNQVSIRPSNSAGLVQVSSGSGLSSGQDSTLTAIAALTSRLDAMLEDAGAYDRWLITALEQAPAGGGGGGGLTAQQVRDALKLAPTAGSPAAGSVDSDLDTLVARNNPLDAAGTRSAVGLGSPNLDTQLGAIDDFIDTEVTAIKAKTDLLTFTGSDVRATLDGETVSVGDKTGFSLTSGERTAIATAVEAALINEGDGQQLINAILQVINANLDLPALELTAIAQAVRSELATELGRIDAAITTRLATAGYTAPDNAGITTLQTRLSSLRAGYLDKLDVSGTLAHTNNANAFKADTAPILTAIALIPTNPLLASSYTAPDNANIGLIKAKTDNLPTDPADQSQVEAAITSATSGLSTLTAAQVWVYSGGDRSLSGTQATAITSAATLAQVQAAGFTTDRHNALIAAEAAARSVASGRHKIDYAASTATQYNADGTVRTVFDLVDEDGDPATSGANAVERVPR